MSSNPIYRRLLNANKWAKLRRLKLQRNPLCEQCRKEGRIRLATEVHHIVPVESGGSEEAMRALAYDYNNLMALCHDCHRDIHLKNPAMRRRSAIANQVARFEHFIKPKSDDDEREGGG